MNTQVTQQEGVFEFVERRLPSAQLNKEGRITHSNLLALMSVVREYQETVRQSTEAR